MLWHGKNFRGILQYAKQMIFDNTGTDLISTNAEDAIKEVNSKLVKVVNGTSFSDLITAINNLTDSQYLLSAVVINGTLILSPYNFLTKAYLLTVSTSNTGVSYNQFLLTPSGTGAYEQFDKLVNGTRNVTNITNTITSWSLRYIG